MTTIKTNLRTTDTDHDGGVVLAGRETHLAFNGVYKLGLIMGSADPVTRHLPVDDDQLPLINAALSRTMQERLFGLAGIGALIAIADTRANLSDDELHGVGSVIQNLALLAQESLDYQERIAIRNKGGL